MRQRLWQVMQADHDLVFALIGGLTGGAGGPGGTLGQRTGLARRLVALSSVHEVAEEMVIWPEVRRRCRDGEDLALEATSQERQGKRALNELSRIKPASTEFDECVDTVAARARAHIAYEQNQIWPRLADCLTDDEADHLADGYLLARGRAPTRPHPHTPPLPSVLASLGTVMAGLDRARDALTGRSVPSP